ncbi:hypothetical protein [Alkalihalobacillus sp. BA299]|uniref:hypothetical protein n=1 Tax=Alkalihalobacillus sp. BA299 TaxID=2815938 RepID=UPI001ADA792F|nr:hypothetical protein [Alkalihalobacillus sp. BA299]
MEDILDRILGFLPQRSVFWTALGTSLLVLGLQTLTQKLNEVVQLPYMKEENQRERQKILGQAKKNKLSKSNP